MSRQIGLDPVRIGQVGADGVAGGGADQLLEAARSMDLQALGLQQGLHIRSQTVNLASALNNVANDSMKRLLENF